MFLTDLFKSPKLSGYEEDKGDWMVDNNEGYGDKLLQFFWKDWQGG
jgi:hypothetical protein